MKKIDNKSNVQEDNDFYTNYSKVVITKNLSNDNIKSMTDCVNILNPSLVNEDEDLCKFDTNNSNNLI
jgi:hypothetical protein